MCHDILSSFTKAVKNLLMKLQILPNPTKKSFTNQNGKIFAEFTAAQNFTHTYMYFFVTLVAQVNVCLTISQSMQKGP